MKYVLWKERQRLEEDTLVSTVAVVGDTILYNIVYCNLLVVVSSDARHLFNDQGAQ